MIPDACSLAVRDGTTVVVGPQGDVRDDYGETGVYADDVCYLDQFTINVIDNESSNADLDQIATKAGPAGVETVLASKATGSGRGSNRPLVVEKQIIPATGTVEATVTISNYDWDARTVTVSVTSNPLFHHIFECPSFFATRDPLKRTGETDSSNGTLEAHATCPDGVTRKVSVSLQDADAVDVENKTTQVTTAIPPGESDSIAVTVEIDLGRRATQILFEPDISTLPHSAVFENAARTLRALMVPDGVPAAGAPRFVAPFGRDALIVGFQVLPFAPQAVETILDHFITRQGDKRDSRTLEEPGKIPHEERRGDRPAVGASLRSPYYGTVDATPLFAALFAKLVEWQGESVITGDRYTAAVDAVEWVLKSLDDGDGLLKYDPHDHRYGLEHLGWKDSADPIAHPNGKPATGSIALTEAQGYAYAALRGVATVAQQVGYSGLASRCNGRAADLRKRFDEAFWLPTEGCYALAVDDDGVVPSVASNQGHALWCQIVPDHRADDVIDRLLESDMQTDAGLRTFAASHEAFDPLSYHRGSVWPHDTSLATLGFAKYDRGDAVGAVAERGLAALEASTSGDPSRWGFPELMVGLSGDVVDTGVVHHPDSCEPAAWSAGAVFGFTRAILGLGVKDATPIVRPAVLKRFNAFRATVRCHSTSYSVDCTNNSSHVAKKASDTNTRHDDAADVR